MAMIQCEECGNWISDRAYSCPHCGCPLADYYDAGYQQEQGAMQARDDEANRQAQRQAQAKFKWNIQSILICIITFAVSFGLGHSLFPKALSEGGSFVPIGLFILSIVLLCLCVFVKMWKQFLFYLLFKHAFFVNMLTIAFSGGYLLGCISGM